MNKTTKALSGIALLIFSCIMFAVNKEYAITDYLFSKLLHNEEVIPTDIIAVEAPSPLPVYSTTSTSTNNTVLFSDDFEGTTPKWTFTNDDDNAWYIGAATNNGGTKAMYISEDSGVTNSYTSSSNVSMASSSKITIPSNVAAVNISYDWRSDGEFITTTVYDYGQVWIVPATFTPVAGTMITTASGGILVQDRLGFQPTYKTENLLVSLNKLKTNEVKLVFQWRDDSSGTRQPPLAIDNVSFSYSDCQGLAKTEITNVSTNSITIQWLPLATGTTAEVAITTTNTAPTAAGTAVTTGVNHTFNGLTADTTYYIWTRSNCSTTSQTNWVGPIVQKTPCASLSLPLDEGFNTTSTTLACWNVVDTNLDATSPTGSNFWKIYTSGVYEGNQAMYFSGGYNIGHDDWLITPTFNVTAGLYKLSYYYKTSSSYTNDFEVLVSQNGPSPSAFTTVLAPMSKYNETNYVKRDIYFQATAGTLNVAWHIVTSSYAYVYLDKVTLEAVNCTDIEKINIINTGVNSVDFDFVDAYNTQWEYVVVPADAAIPAAGTSTNSKTNTTTTTQTGLTLQPNTTYDLYVRAKCGTSAAFNAWVGPARFKTQCGVVALPFSEGFNTGSTNLECWSIIDVKKDGNSSGENKWLNYNYSMYEGDRVMRFDGGYNINHDDWLISPTFNVTSGLHKLTYYYKTSTSYTNDFEVLLSQNGIATTSFTTVLVPMSKYNVANYIKKEIYFQATTGTLNLAWHIVTSGYAYIYIDQVTVEAVNCSDIENIDIKGTTANSVDFSFVDILNTQWQYAIVATGGTKPTSGTNTNTKTNIANTTTAATNLQANTLYDLYVRAKCGTGTTYNDWVGPVTFRTLCNPITLPFDEGFNTTSTTFNCWTLNDVKGDATSPTGNNLWKQYNLSTYEGDRTMYFSGGANIDHDDWLISPTFNFAPNTAYKLTYYYKTSSSYTNDFEVLLSNSGTTPSSFTTTLVPKQSYQTSSFIKKVVYIEGVAGNVNIAWHVQTKSYAYVYIDKVTIEKVDCIPPTLPEVTGVTTNSVDLKWTDTKSTQWEYSIQAKDAGLPTGNGSLATTNPVTATKDSAGNNITPGTEYEYYVRSKCTNGGYSDWVGPVVFFTTCANYLPPYNETFNSNSNSARCWTVNDVKNDATSPTGSNLWRSIASGTFEGDRAMYFYGNNNINHDDWLISPAITLAGKMYKVTYQYKTSTSYDNDFEFAMSTNGTNFTNATTLITKQKIKQANYTEEVVYIKNTTGNVHFGFHVSAKNYATIYIDYFNIEEISCTDPININFTNINSNGVTINWTDNINTDWNYHVQEVGYPIPSGNGVATTSKSNVLTTNTDTNSPLLPQTEYEVYLRSDCGNNEKGNWQGPFIFKTGCLNATIPFNEEFETTSPTVECWTLIDANNDATSATGNNLWRINASGGATGRAMYFSGNSKQHDDWLISPTFTFAANSMYELTYKYKTSTTTSYENQFSVRTSNTGKSPANFTNVVLPSKKYFNGNYVTEIIYIQGVSGNVNIAWHVDAAKSNIIYIDDVAIRKVDCIAPKLEDLSISNVTANGATVSWNYTHNNGFHSVYVQTTGLPAPTSGGSNSTGSSTNITTVNTAGNTPIAPDTEYDVYVRASCGSGKYSSWVGPIKFRTTCSLVTLPYWQGFNTTSTGINCWTFINNTGVKSALTTTGRWKIYASSSYSFEGDRAVEFYGSAANDWLISPTFNTVSTKYYRLKYHYRAWSSTGKIEVAYSTNGIEVADFKNTLVPAKDIKDNIYREENVVFKGTGTNVNIGWKVEATATQDVLIDNIFIEEVEGCPEPSDLGVKNEQANSATITWDQKFEGSQWEYYVQKSGGNAPTNTTVGGGKVTIKEANVTTDNTGVTLQSNTEYEFYVRTVCNATQNSIWVGPFKFMTACGVFNAPFNEGFNNGSPTLRCWTILDNNADAASATSTNIWRVSTSTKFEGSQSMEFSGTNKQHDDYLISPTIKLDATKVYRLKYYYRTSGTLSNKNEFEVLLSKTGTNASNFTTTILSKKVYENSTAWKQEYRFITGQSGDINIAFHATSDSSTNIFIDQFEIEEVENCPEPLDLDASNITHNQADLSWTDDFGATKFEYFVQEVGKREPRLNDRGTPIMGKSITATKDNRTRANLLPNTEYKFYVRTLCDDKTYSIWAGPFKFRTSCSYYQTPFEEGFNTSSTSITCWSILDPSNNIATTGNNIWKGDDTKDPAEGDKHASYTGNGGILHDAWLITPDLDLDAGQYILKYRYKTSANQNNEFEVLLSSTGINPTAFTQTIVSKTIYKTAKYTDVAVVFTSASKAISNIAWHITSNGSTSVLIDKVEVKKIYTCPEPSNIELVSNTTNSFEVTWQENGSAIAWEVIVVPFGEPETATPIATVTVTNNPTTVITGLDASRRYTIYVRSTCLDGVSKSDWSSAGGGYTKVGANDECSGAITLIPNSTMEDCTNTFYGVTDGATITSANTPLCWPDLPKGPNDPIVKEKLADQWFEFTPIHAINAIKINNVINLTTGLNETQTFYVAVYDITCAAATTQVPTTNPLTKVEKWCNTLVSTNTAGMSISDMIPGQKYLIRIAYKPTGTARHSFDLCISSHDGNYLEVTPSQPAEPGDPDDPNFVADPTKPYTIDKLIKNVLVNSNCKLVSNVRYQNGNGSTAAMAYNTIGYFNKGQTDFPFDEGIVLATNEVQYVPGPAQQSSFDNRGNNSQRWAGDKDIKDLISDAGGGPSATPRITQLEFDFIPIKEVLQFEYLFASNSYHSDCTSVGCNAGALFGAWLIDLETGKGMNLAKVNGTDTPIALNTVVDNTKTGKNCTTMNPELYWRHYNNRINNNLGAAIDFVGLTKAMKSDETLVVPGRKYHIKLAVIDFCGTVAHTSAAFFKAGSFDLGDLDLGADLTVENNNAICNAESRTIATGLGTENVEIKWFKNNVEIPGETKPNLTVTETGTYRVEAFYTKVQCAVKGEIKAEIYPAISKIVAQAETINICRYSLVPQKINLEGVVDKMFEGVDTTPYMVQLYRTEEDLEYSVDEIKDLANFEIMPNEKDETFYFRIEDTRTGCVEIFPLTIKLEEGEKPTKPENVVVCDAYTLPKLPDNYYYYSESGAQGVEYKAGDVLQAGNYELFVFKDNGNGCYEETSFKVDVTAKTPIQHFEDMTLECELFELPDLNDGSKYFIELNGQRVEVQPKTLITTTNTRVYIVMESDNKVCYEETSFMIRYNDCPIPKGISPNGDGFNDRFDLSKHGVTSIKIFNRSGSEVYSFQGIYTDQWDGRGKNNVFLPDGTYYYVIQSFDKTRTGWVQLNK